MPQRVVLVDDDAFMAEVVGTMLGALGVADVVTVTNGQAALDALLEEPDGTQIVVCDLRMPEMDGIELIRHLSARKGCHGIILLSGEGDRILASAKELALAQGLPVLGALRKPVTLDRLKRMLRMIGARRPTSTRANLTRDGFCPDAKDLSRAIAAREFVVHYQPLIALRERRVCGVEGLVRWQHPKGGLLPPVSFIELAEDNGLIDALTRVVFEIGFADLARWRRAGHNLSLSLNATVDTLSKLDFANQIVALAAHERVPLESVIVELTESRLMTHFEKVLETLTRLRLQRVGIAIDDFGTGYSTMDQLRRIPFTELKIDRAFVHGAHEDRTTRAILESSLTLARQLDLTSVAEGAETKLDVELVERLGCDQVQGYYFAMPMPEADLLPWLKNFTM